MTMVLDPNALVLMDQFISIDPNYTENLEYFNNELSTILLSENLELVELFHKIATKYVYIQSYII